MYYEKICQRLRAKDRFKFISRSGKRKICIDWVSASQARQELNPSQVSAYLRITRESREVDDTCISGDSLKGICRADNQKHIIKYKRDSPKEFGAQ